MNFLSIHFNRSADAGSVTVSKQTHRKFCTSCSHQTGDADHFAAAYIKGYVVNHFLCRCHRMMNGPMIDFHTNLADLDIFSGWETIAQFSSNHAADNTVFTEIVHFFIHRLNRGAVTDNRNLICHVRNFI